VALLFVQLIWGAMVRHTPNAINQRLHLLTAFLAVAATAWLLRTGFTSAARPRIASTGWVLGTLIALQVALGVEAWMGKFGEEARDGRPASSYLAEAAPVTREQAKMRTAHTLVGTGVLAAAVILLIRIRQRPMVARENPIDRSVIWDRQFAPEPALELTAPGKLP
jgi:heme A synthase